MATMQAAVFGLLLASCMLSAQAIELGDPSEILDLDSLCTSQLNTLWLKYTNSSGVPGCDQACLSQCYTTLQNALYATNNKDCPLQTDIQRCFHVFSDDWEDYVKECELFAWTDSESEGESNSSSSSEGEASPSSTDAGSEAEASPSPSSTDAKSEAEASPSPSSSGAESEAEASPSPSSEEEASPSPASEEEASPSPASEEEAESSPSPSQESSEAQASPSPSAAESEASPSPSSGRRRLLSEGEGEGVAGGGCFPAFASPADFEKYIDGEWEFEGSSNGAGIGLSVAFFVGLVGLALFLKT